MSSELESLKTFSEVSGIVAAQTVTKRGERIVVFQLLAKKQREPEARALQELIKVRLKPEGDAKTDEEARLILEVEEAEKARQDALVVSSSNLVIACMENEIGEIRGEQ